MDHVTDPKRTKAFWRALVAGIAAPTGLYAPVPHYMGYVGLYGLGQTGGQVVAQMSEATSRVRSELGKKRTG